MESRRRYARIERERRFLVNRFPAGLEVAGVRHIIDRYISGTRLRLREQRDGDGAPVYKLTQKVPETGEGAQRGLITTIYLDDGEYRVVAQLPAKVLTKTRYSVPPFGVDVFTGELKGLILAEAEFEAEGEAERLIVPSFIGQEVSEDDRFTGGQLALASRPAMRRVLVDMARARLAERRRG